MFSEISDRRGAKRPVRDRLGSSYVRSSPSFPNKRFIHRRQTQDSTNRHAALHEENNHVIRKAVPEDAKPSKLEKDVLKSSKRDFASATASQEVDIMNSQTPKAVSSVGLKGTSTAKVLSAKEPEAPVSGEKKCILLTTDLFLEKLGLSKYRVSFKAEEIDMYALKHMDDDDLKSIGVPMGPRKKILHAIARLTSRK